MITLTSSVNPSDVVTLSNPKFGNSDTINFKRVNRTSRGNDEIIAGYPQWHPTFLKKYEFDYMKESEAVAIYAFVKRHTGIPVFVTGLYGVTKKVLLLKPDVEISQVGVENRTIILDMQETIP